MTLQRILGAAALTLVITAAYAATAIGPEDHAGAKAAANTADTAAASGEAAAPDRGGG